MPNLDSTGKFGRSLDCSQIISFKKKYITVQEQNGKTPPGDQKQKPAFNSDHMSGGDSENGASAYYNQKGSSLFFKRFFGNNSNSDSAYSIDSRFREYVEIATLSFGDTIEFLSLVINSLTNTTISVTSVTRTISSGQINTQSFPSIPITNLTTDSILQPSSSAVFYRNNATTPIFVLTSEEYLRRYSPGQIFTDDEYPVSKFSFDERINEFVDFYNHVSIAAANKFFSFDIDSVTDTTLTFSNIFLTPSGSFVETPPQTTPYTKVTVDSTLTTPGSFYRNTGTNPITVTTSDGYTRIYSPGQFFINDEFYENMFSIDPKFIEFTTFSNRFAAPNDKVVSLIAETTPSEFTFRTLTKSRSSSAVPFTAYTTFDPGSTIPPTLGFGWYFNNTGASITFNNTLSGRTRTYSTNQIFAGDGFLADM